MQISPIVQSEIEERYRPEDAQRIAVKFSATPLPFLDAPGREQEAARVHLAVLLLAGDMPQEIDKWLNEAAKDWRDVLVAAGMENEDWPDILDAAGFRVP
jgi:hypothetical protein